MREASTYREIEPDFVPDNEVAEPFGAVREANRAARSVALAADRVMLLVRRAMECLETDRPATLRCLNDVLALLGAQEQGPRTNPFEVLSGFQAGGLTRWQARRTLAHIEENLGSKLAIRELAALVSFSKSHFSRAFKHTLGISPMAYVNTRRVERAKAMIISTDQQLTDIALACGFADQSHLNRSFRRVVGMSPGRWRRMNTEIDGAGAG